MPFDFPSLLTLKGTYYTTEHTSTFHLPFFLTSLTEVLDSYVDNALLMGPLDCSHSKSKWCW